MRRQFSPPLAFLALFFVAGCASSGIQRSSGSPDKLTRAQIAETRAPSAYDVLTRLRPNWLNPPGMTMTGMQNSRTPQVLVYVDGIRFGGTETLRTIITSTIASMEFLSPTKAANVVRDLGTGVASAVIMVNTK